MGRVTQILDYLSRPSDKLGADFIKANYTHIEITPSLKELRKNLKWYRGENEVVNNDYLCIDFGEDLCEENNET
jgi:DhnA family fructose-bisphosphate aldolase class Ia